MSTLSHISDFIEQRRDPRVAEWILTRSPLPPFVLVVSYLLFVLWIGPLYMKKRKPFELKNVLFVYNVVQVLFNAMMFAMLLDAGWFGKYSFVCEPIDYSNTHFAMKMPNVGWWYYLFKLVDLLDTVFFVLRKKFHQVSFLHVYHHTIMPIYIWFGVNFWPGGHGTFFVLLNTFVHVVMYGYYLLASMGPEYQKYLWWKKYVTGLQIIQFALVIFHALQLLWVDCNYPNQLVYVILINAAIFFYLFRTFYNDNYLITRSKTK